MTEFQTRLKACGFRGDIHEDLPTRLLNATDNSIYELLPQGVLQPMDAGDLAILVQVANEAVFQSLTFSARGGGTGTNGQSLNRGWVVDTSRYMTRILNFDLEKREVTVEPGVVLSELNRFLKPHGLFFAPSVSTADRATIGGMISTDAAGKGSLVYGKTSDHLTSMDIVMLENDLTLDDLSQKIQTLLEPLQTEIQKRFPNLKRPLSGYNLKQSYENGKVNLNRLIAGSEGTLAFISSATLKLLPIPQYSSLVVIHYPDFMSALKDAPFLIEQGPVAIEVIDDHVQRCVDGRTEVSNFIEFAEHEAKTLEDKLKRFAETLDKRGSSYQIVDSKVEQAKIWGIRSAAVGLVGRLPGTKKPVAFVEDAIVPPENLCDFVREFQDLLKNQNLQYAMYGHSDVGCVHARPALDLKTPEDRAKVRIISEAVLALTEKYHGLLWGEHGKGFRGEFVAQVFGPQLYAAMAQIKTWFDPHNRLNPGKLVAPSGDPRVLDHIDKVPMRGEFDAIIEPRLQQQYEKAMICNGNAACFNREPTNVMCPSYKVTHDRIHSPKGRAMLVKEWLRAQSKSHDPKDSLAIADDVLNAMNGCLGCKGCTGKCPVNVSIPDLRSNFLEAYYRIYRRRPLRDHIMAWVEDLLLIAARFPWIWNLAVWSRVLPTFGLRDLPLIPARKSGLHYHRNLKPESLKGKPVVILADPFTTILDQEILISTYRSLKKLGFKPYILSPRATGKALVVSGFLKSFKRQSKRWAKILNPLFEAKIPVIGLENSIVLMFRDEFQKFGNQTLKGSVLSLGEYFKSVCPLSPLSEEHPAKFCLLPHCTEQALLPEEAKHWQDIFAKWGMSLSVQNVGCCGMAGLYGYQKEHLANSRALFEMHWQPVLTNKVIPLATGFSCRSQAQRFGNKKLQHPIEILSNCLNQMP